MTNENEKTVMEIEKGVKTSGVFKIVNKVTGSEYFGASGQIEVCYRDYMKWLENQKHSNQKMQDEFNAHGKDSFEIHILEEIPGATRPELNAARKKHQGVEDKPKAEKKPQLTEEQVAEVKELLANGEKVAAVAEKFQVSKSTIYAVKKQSASDGEQVPEVQ